LRGHLARELHLVGCDRRLLLVIEVIAASGELPLQVGLISMQLLQIHYLSRIQLNLVFNFSEVGLQFLLVLLLNHFLNVQGLAVIQRLHVKLLLAGGRSLRARRR